MSPAEVLAHLQEANPEAWLLEPRSVYDLALVGVTDNPDDHWPRPFLIPVAVYSAELCVTLSAQKFGMSLDEALEHFTHNTEGAWVGQNTPTFER